MATNVTTSPIGIARSNRLFIRIAEIGECDEKGKAVFARRGFPKLIAVADKPITTCILPVLAVLLQSSHIDDPALRESEMTALKNFVAGLGISGGAGEERKP